MSYIPPILPVAANIAEPTEAVRWITHMQALINEYLVDEASSDKSAAALAEMVGGGSLLELVSLLGDHLVLADNNVRVRATSCLVDTLKYVKGLNRQQVEVLTVFLLDRLSDEAALQVVLNGLLTLSNLGNFSRSSASQCLARLAKLEIRKQPQPTRQALFVLLYSLVRYEAPEFVEAFLDLASGEKDPQNLMVSLAISGQILQKYPLSDQQREDMFDVTFCYFPVTFTPPKDMPYSITADEIRLRLRETLSSPVISQWTVPGLIGKLTAVNIGVKIDTLETLNAALEKLDEGQLHLYWAEVWAGVKFEVLHGSPESETQPPALKVLHQLTREGEFSAAVVDEFSNLKAAKLGPQIAQLIVGVCDAQQLDLYTRLSNAALEELLKSPADELASAVPTFNVFLEAPFPIGHGDALVGALLASVDGDADYRADATKGLSLLALKDADLAPLIVQKLTALLADKQVHDAAVEGLRRLVPTYNNLIVSQTLSELLSNLPDQWSPEIVEQLNTLAAICQSKVLVQTLTVRLYNRASALADLRYLEAVLNTLVTAAGSLPRQDLVGYADHVLPLFEEFVSAQRTKSPLTHDIAVDKAAKLAEIAGRGVPASQQPAYALKLKHLFIEKGQLLRGARASNLFCLFVSAIAPLDQPPPLEISFVDLAGTLSQSRDVFTRSGYLRIVALTANKWPALLGNINLYFQWLRKNIETRGPDMLNSLELLAWLAKGLLLRSDNLGFDIARFLVDLLANPTLGPYAAKVFGVLLANDRVLVKENGVTVRQLYKQRLFLTEIGPIIAGYSTPQRYNYIVALSAILRYTPGKIIVPQMESILPLLLDALSLRIEAVQLAAVGAVLMTLADAKTVFAPHLGQIIPRLLALGNDTAAAEPVRTAALSTLAELAQVMGSGPIEPFKNTIITGLVPALGDPRRAVRRQATRCRQLYFG